MAGSKIKPTTQIMQDGATNGQVLTWNNTTGKWEPQTPSGGGSYTDPLTTKGDLVGRNATTTVRIPVGTDGQVLKADSTASTGLAWGTGGGSGSGNFYAEPMGSADISRATPNSADDEFDGSSTVSWAATPTAANVFDINTTRPGHCYIKASGSSAAYVGKYQAVPGSYPYTIVTKLTSSTARGNYQRGGGIILLPASPTGTSNILYSGEVFNAQRGVQRIVAQANGTLVSQSGAVLTYYWSQLYIKVVVNSATSVDTYTSTDGWAWQAVETAFNPGFTPAYMGLATNEEGTSDCESFFDYFRVNPGAAAASTANGKNYSSRHYARATFR